MADSLVEQSISCLWTIENFSYFVRHNHEACLKTPPFHNRLLWHLILRPLSKYGSQFIYFYLQKESEFPTCDLELSFIDSDGSCFKRYQKKSCDIIRTYGDSEFIAREDIFRNKNLYLPKDTLTVCCRLYIKEADCRVTGNYFARTQISVIKRKFPCFIPITIAPYDNFLETVYIEESSFSMRFFFESGITAETKFKLEIKFQDFPNCFLTCKIDIMDAKGISRISFQDGFRYYTELDPKIWNFPISITKNDILSAKGNYLKDGKLFLQCELAVSFGEVSTDFEKVDTLYPCLSSSNTKKRQYSEDEGVSKEVTSLKDDIFCAYKDQKFMDATLCTAEKQFPVHRVILSARSPVFSRMFEAAFNEGKTGVVEIPDVDADTTRRMLQFIYTDSVEDLDWEEASSLYRAADKYDIQALRKKCASILESKLSVSNICEAVLLAELYEGQSDLRKVVQDFVVAHEEDVLQSEEWGTLEESHPRATAKVLRQVCLQKLANTK